MIKNQENSGIDPNKILQQFYILYDEIDSILDPIKSNFNKIIYENECVDYIKEVKPILYSIYIKELYRLYENQDYKDKVELKNILKENKNKLLNKCINVYNNDLYKSYEFIKSLKYNYEYGFSTIKTHNTDFIGVPYEHVETPAVNSYFTELTHTIIATLLCYVNKFKTVSLTRC